nr:amidohydrolase [Streptomyces sp. TP-A0874]
MDRLKEILRPVTAFCLDIHRHPETSGQERRTAGRLAAWLADEGYEVTGSVGGHGVVGLLRNGAGPTVMLRAELDALPVRERTGLPYASEGAASHACGHDLHLAAVAGAASLLARSTAGWSGRVMVVGQPAEETLEGARAMLADGLYERFGRPDTVLAQHTAPLPAGMVAHGYGPVMAGSVDYEITVHGAGGHAGTPQLGVDPVLTAAAMVMRLQGVVSRESSPAEQVVLTVGSLHAGEARNVVPDRATLGLTVRAHAAETLERVAAAVERVVRAECAASGCPRDPDITVVSDSPATVPDPVATAAVRKAHTELYGPRRVSDWPPAMATEDFAFFGDAGRALHGHSGIRLVYWMLGSVGPGQWARAGGPGATAAQKLAALPSNHAPEFACDLRTGLPTGVTAMTTAALRFLDGRPGEPSRATPRSTGGGPGESSESAQ